ncbi:unnamed protein product [Darwinula stevensoni]|uniref:Sulfite oxidase n=1 Tax=Darwinula stevensoni TaxID=69355 RepID=A0A7R8XIL8_9CRUS|nr:unnamed protein product [Darwinula stevensoni]CAG0891391.1 unnamed protein product [Darwinula stevensoni]
MASAIGRASLKTWLISRHVDSAAKSLTSYIIHDTQFRKSSSGSYSDEGKSTSSWTLGRLTVAGGVAAGFGLLYGWSREHEGVQAATVEEGVFVKGLPNYSLDEVSKHSTESSAWMTYKRGVYDVTEFIKHHPGGKTIMLGVGGAADPFWHLYAVHKEPHVLKLLSQYRIGNLEEDDVEHQTKNMDDPYANEPKRHPALKPTSQKPFNAEPPAALLVANFHTPNELFYVRNHLPVPEVDEKDYSLTLEGEGVKTLTLTLDELKKKFPKYKLSAAIQCAGNRRSELSKFEGLDLDATGSPYGASVPAERALDPKSEVLLAYEMNGEPLSRDHGFPVRVIIPGVVGARSVKWLSNIILSKEESTSHWQQNDYKGFCPSVDWDTVDFKSAPAIQELPVMSLICEPGNGWRVKAKDGKIAVKGYAWSGGGRKIVRVDVTGDQGKTWHVAKLQQEDKKHGRHWAWTLWTVEIPVDPKGKQTEIWAKAVDSSYNTQPESSAHIWNLRGVLSNAYHKVIVNLIQ